MRSGSGSQLANGLDGLPPVRVGVNTGPAVERDGDFFGSTVNLAARLSQAARGGEVLLTEATRAAARTPRDAARGARRADVPQRARSGRRVRGERAAAAADAPARREAALRLPAHGRADQDRLMAVKGLPPRVELSRVVFMTRFMLHPDKLLDKAYRDHGDFFHFVTPLERTMCVTANPETIKQVFRGDPEIFRAGRGATRCSAPLVGPHSTLLLDGAEHLRHRKLLLPPFHGERMREYGELMAEVAERHVSAWPKDEPFSAIESTQAITLEVIQRAVFGIEDGRRLDHVARLLRAVLDPMANRWQMLDADARAVELGAAQPLGPLPPAGARGGRGDLRGDPRAPGRPRRGGARRRHVAAAAGARRGRRAAVRQGAARRARHAARRRARDHGHLARVDARADHAPSGGAGAARGRSRTASTSTR